MLSWKGVRLSQWWTYDFLLQSRSAPCWSLFVFPVLEGWSLSLANSGCLFLLCPVLGWEAGWLSTMEKCGWGPKNRCPENHFRASQTQRICSISLRPVLFQPQSLASEAGRIPLWLSWEGRRECPWLPAVPVWRRRSSLELLPCRDVPFFLSFFLHFPVLPLFTVLVAQTLVRLGGTPSGRQLER